MDSLEKTDANASDDRSARLRIFDCDVHPVPRPGLNSLARYLPKAWKERFDRKQALHDGLNVPIRFKHPNGTVVRRDCAPDGGPPASSPRILVRDLLETHGIEGALLNCFDAGGLLSAQASTEESIVIASAYNDYFINEWLGVDRRLKYAPAVPTQDPVAAAAEIRRLGKHPQVAAIYVPLVNVLMGHRYYWPIYEACEDLGLPVYIHVTGIESIFGGTPTMGMGTFESYIERYAAVPQMGMVSVTSIILSGLLEKFSTLKFVFAEYGFLWLPSSSTGWTGPGADCGMRFPGCASRLGTTCTSGSSSRLNRATSPIVRATSLRWSPCLRGSPLLQQRLPALGQRHAGQHPADAVAECAQGRVL